MNEPLIISPHKPCPIFARGAAVVIGNFDGVHIGHKALIEAAKLTGLRVVALTFSPHPKAYFTGKPIFALTSPQEKAELLEKAGVSAIAVCDFDLQLAKLYPQQFIDNILVNWLGAKAVLTGENFRFGKNRAGSREELSAQHFQYIEVKPCLYDGLAVSSSRVREALQEGDMSLANALLGRIYAVSGIVSHGAKQGRTLGYPTANIALDENTKLKQGIYAVTVKIGGAQYKGVCSYGTRPMFDNGKPLLETYIFDFKGDIYGQKIEVFLHSYIRPEQKFDGLEALKAQMNNDCVIAQEKLENERLENV